MPKRGQAHRTPPAAETPRQIWAARLDAAAFYLVLLIVAMRPMLGETFSSNLDAMSRVADAVGEPTPATTAWLDFAVWAAAIATALASFLVKRAWRLTGVEWGGLVLVVAATISSLAASNQRLALNASTNWLTALVLVSVVANLSRDRMRMGLLLAALAASGMATVARSGMQVAVEYPETREHYEEVKDDFWARQNVSPDDSRVTLYERRLDAAEAGGFFALSNTNGIWLALAGFASLGLSGLVWRTRRLRFLLWVPAAMAFAAILLTGSKGALLATGIGLFIWLILVRYQLELQDRWRLTLLGGWLCLVGLISVGVTYGVAKGGLPGDSLQFRWNYWQVTQGIIAEHLVTGVGALNFDHAYLAHKPAEFPEEIRDPHNFILSILAQWGLLGGLGLLAVFVGGSIVAARTWGVREPTDAPPPVYDPEAKVLSLQWVVAVAIGFVLLRIWLLRGWLIQDTGPAYVFFDIGLYGMIWILVFAGICWVVRGGWTGDIDMCQVGCLAGALAFVLHGLIDLAMFFPGALTPFAVMVGVLLADKPRPGRQADTASRPAVPLILCATGALALVVLVLIPVSRADSLLQRARYRATSLAEQLALYEAAMRADPLDPTAPLELAFAHAGSGGDLSEALQYLNEAIRRDPQQAGLYRSRAQLHEMSFWRTGAMTDLVGAVGSARRLVSMYPESPDDHLFLADLLARHLDADEEESTLEEAIVHYQRALELDEARHPTELRRWPASRRRAVEEKLAQLMDMAAAAAMATTEPAPESVQTP